MQFSLGENYSLREIVKAGYDEYRAQFEPLIFPNRFDINATGAMNGEELAGVDLLKQRMGKPFELRLGYFDGDKMIGWHYGIQVSADTFRMATSGIHPEYQGRKLYSKSLPVIAQVLKEAGFQIILSRHYATDNQVIVPKMRFGFLVSGFELTDEYGLLLRLSYFFNETRRKIMHTRSGLQQPDEDVRSLIRRYQ